MNIRKAMTIAGSDSGGGAGIQADLKTFAALGVYGSSTVTAITVQNTLGVQAAAGVSLPLVEGQLDSVLGDIGADAVKTGMLYDEAITEMVAGRLKFYQVPCLVVDPVIIATSGEALLNDNGVQTLREKLLPLASYITPNVDEAASLCGFAIENDRDLEKAARELHCLGAGFVIITGLRDGQESVDFCYDGYEFQKLKSAFIDTPHTHGTGCSFSAALAAFTARGYSSWAAAAAAKKYVASGLRYGYRVGRGRSPINHQAIFYPASLDDIDILEIRSGAFHDWGSKPGFKQLPMLNVIIGGHLCSGKDYAELTRLTVKNGAGIIQLREKEGETRQLVDTAEKMRKVCHEHGALFIVNDRVDVAIASGADGVHIGQDDLSPQLARALLGPGKIIGVSAASMAEAEAAVAAGSDYLGVGPVYPTISKECKIDACGLDTLAGIAASVPVPVIAIGGITPENTAPLLKSGAAGVAVISAILGSGDPARAINDFMRVLI